MSSYYYFVATLPSLQPGGAPPFSSADFLGQCARYLSPADLEVVRAIGLSSPPQGAQAAGGLGLLERYYRWERALRDELAILRSRKLGAAAPERHGKSGESANAATAALVAFHAETPLEGELAIERERWAFVDGLSPIRTFDLESIAAWYLKLLVLERLASFATARGEAGYRKVYADIMEGWRSGPAPTSSSTGVPR